MNKISFTFLVWGVCCLGLSAMGQSAFSEKRILKHISYLADDKLEGRGTGTPGEQAAAQYIIRQFKKHKLQPISTTGSYLQPFTTKKAGKEVTAANVVGFLNNGAARTVVVGAHYDHLGRGDQGSSLKPNSEGEIHNGADDNASGVAGMLELARHFAKNKRTEGVNILFIGFSGEELGLVGSKYFCENPTIDLKQVAFMLNMDMIGRYREEKGVTIGGWGTSAFWGKEVPPLTQSLGLKYTVDSSGVGPSDHTSFYLKDLPVVFFFTGGHQDYHKPSDDTPLVNANGEAKLLNLAVKLIEKAEQNPAAVDFRKTNNPHARSTASSFKVTLGIMPDYSFDKGGVRIDGVTDGRPAAKAGIQQGDILLQLGEYPLKDVMEYMKALGKFEKGQTVKALVKRSGETLEKMVTF